MAYIAASDLRGGALYPYIDIPENVGTTRLEAMIDAASNMVDVYCRDHFEVTAGTLSLYGDRSDFLVIPKRIRAVTAVNVLDYSGDSSSFDSTFWRVETSFGDVTGSNVVQNGAGHDGLALKKLLTVGDGGGYWPGRPWTINVAGTFDWAATPEAVKWATAQIVWYWCRTDLPPGVDSIDTGAAVLRRGVRREDSTGLGEVDAHLSAAGLRRVQYGGLAIV